MEVFLASGGENLIKFCFDSDLFSVFLKVEKEKFLLRGVFMAGGEGGFSQAAMGFNKKEVNDYIAKINQRMKEVEAEKKDNDAKTQEALKKAREADAKIKAAVEEGKKNAAQLEEQLKQERKNSEALTRQIDDLKLKLKQKASVDASGAKNADAKAQAVVAKANEQAKQIIEKANATARDTVEKAKAAATKMVSEAGASGGGVNTAGLDEFMGVFNSFIRKITSGVNEVNQKASELLGAPAAEPVTVPDFSNITAPQAEAPKAAPAPKAAKSGKPGKSAADDLFALLEDDEPETNNAEEDDDLEMVTEVQPLDDPKGAPTAVVLEEFDLSATADMDLDLDTPVTEVRPLDSNKRGSDHLVDDDFEKQMLAQTANSASLRNELNEDLLASVKQKEEQFAVKPSKDDVGDFSMDMTEEDPFAALMKEANNIFGGGAGASVEEETAEEEAPSTGGSDNPWAALQDELFAMEKSGDLDNSDDDGGSSGGSDPTAPSADDSSIWDFGEDTSSSDDDMGMSSDLFGNF